MPGDSPSPAPICTIEYGRFRLRAPLPVFLPDFERRILMRGAPATVDTAFYRSQPAPDPSHPLSEYQYLQKSGVSSRPIVENMYLPAVQQAAATPLLLQMLKRSFSTKHSRAPQKKSVQALTA